MSNARYTERPIGLPIPALHPQEVCHGSFVSASPIAASLSHLLIRCDDPRWVILCSCIIGHRWIAQWNMPFDGFLAAPDRPGFYIAPFPSDGLVEELKVGEEIKVDVRSRRTDGPALHVDIILPFRGPPGEG